MESEWVQVVSSTSQREGRAEFERWRSANPEVSARLRAEDVRIDLLHLGPGRGCLVRYLVRRATLGAKE
jgi:hypothetical protein